MAVPCDICGKSIEDALSARLIGAQAICGPCYAKMQQASLDVAQMAGQPSTLPQRWLRRTAQTLRVAAVIAIIVMVAGVLLWAIPLVRNVVFVGVVLLFHGFGIVIVFLLVLLILLGIRRIRRRSKANGITKEPDIDIAVLSTGSQPPRVFLQTTLGIAASSLALAAVVVLICWMLILPFVGLTMQVVWLANSKYNLMSFLPFLLIPVAAIGVLVTASLLANMGKCVAQRRKIGELLPQVVFHMVGRILLLIINSVVSALVIVFFLMLAGSSHSRFYLLGLGVVAGIGAWFLRRRPGAAPGSAVRDVGLGFVQVLMFWCVVLLAIMLTGHLWTYLYR